MVSLSWAILTVSYKKPRQQDDSYDFGNRPITVDVCDIPVLMLT